MAAARKPGPLGREDILAGLARAVDDAMTGTGRVILLTGEAGIGKTTMLAEAAREAEDRGARVAWGWGWAGEGAPGYWPWIQVTRALGLELPPTAGPDPAAGPVPGAEAPGSARFRFFDDVTSLLLAESRIQPLVIILDDLQWADQSSLLLLDFLARRLPAGAAAVLGAYRDAAAAAGLDGPAPAGQVPAGPVPAGPVQAGPGPAGQPSPLSVVIAHSTVVPLAGLADAAVADLITRVTGKRADGPLVADMRRRTGGNPFFIEQLCWLMKAGGSGVPPGVREALAERFSSLAPATIATLGAAALAGQRFTAELVAEVTEAPPGRTLAELEACAEAALLARDGPGEFGFSHDLFREYAAGCLPVTQHPRLHERIGLALEAASARGGGISPAELAWHFVRADPGSGRAYRYSGQAARQATARLAFDEAASHWEAALAAADRGAASGTQALLQLADARWRAGAGQRAGEAYLRAAELARREGDVRNLARAALGLQAIGVRMWWPPDELIGVLSEALAELDDASADGGDAELAVLRARVLASLARTLAWHGRQLVRARKLAADAVATARAAGDQPALAVCLLAQHIAIWQPGTARERRALAAEVAALAGQIGDTELLVEARVLAVADLLELADPGFRAELDEFLRLADASGQPRLSYSALVRRAMLALLAGRFTDAARLIDEAALLGRECGEPQADDVWSDQSWDLLTALGRRAELAESASGIFPDPDSRQARGLRALVLLAAGDRAQAAEAAAPLLTEDAAPVLRHQTGEDSGGADTTAQRPAQRLLDAAFGVELITSLGRPAMAEVLYEALAPFAGYAVVSGAAITFRGAVDHHLGLLAAFTGRRAEAAEHLARAIAAHEALGARPWALRSRLELARLRAGEPVHRDGALAELDELGTAARQLGMAQLASDAAEAAAAVTADHAGRAAAQPMSGEFRRDGAFWTMSFAGRTIRMRDAKGLGDLAVLLSGPGREFAAADLVAAAGAGEVARSALALGADEILDETARRQIRARLADLGEEIAEAELWSDPERAARARAERDELVSHLAAATGLGGRSRLLGDQAERARKAVTARIRDAVARIEAAHPALGAHLQASVTTGTRCSYSPQTPVTWRL